MSKEEQKGLGDEIYSGAASFGVLYSLIGAVLATIIGIIMIIGGLYLLTKKVEYDQVEGKILNLSCRNVENNNQTCSINISYKYNDKEENKFINYTGKNTYIISQKLPVYINKNSNTASIEAPFPKWGAALLAIFGLIIIMSGWFWYWASKKYKFVGAASGFGGFINIINPRH